MHPQRGQARDGPWPDGGDDCLRRLLTCRGQLPGRVCTFLHMKVLPCMDEAVCQVFGTDPEFPLLGLPPTPHGDDRPESGCGAGRVLISCRQNQEGPQRPCPPACDKAVTPTLWGGSAGDCDRAVPGGAQAIGSRGQQHPGEGAPHSQLLARAPPRQPDKGAQEPPSAARPPRHTPRGSHTGGGRPRGLCRLMLPPHATRSARCSPCRGRPPPCRWPAPGTAGGSRPLEGAPCAARSASGTSSQTGCAP